MADARTMRDLAKEALDIQSSCDILSVANSFSSCMNQLREIAKEEGWLDRTDLSQHPICVIFSTKVANLTNLTQSILSGELTYAIDWAVKTTSEETFSED
jgi:hypothetical protein